MDASASPKSDAVNVLGFFFKIDETNFVQPIKNKSTVIKYTKIPDFDFDTKVSWPSSHSYTLQPRLRRIIAIDDDDLRSNRSLKSKIARTPKSNDASRKIVTISENEEYGLHPRFCDVKEKSSSTISTSYRAFKPDVNSEKQSSNRMVSKLGSSTKFPIKEKANPVKIATRAVETHTYSQKCNMNNRSLISPRVSSTSKFTKESKASAKINSATYKKEVNIPHSTYRAKQTTSNLSENTKSRQIKEKVPLRSTKSGHVTRSSLGRYIDEPKENDQELRQLKSILYENLKTDFACKQKPINKPLPSRMPVPQNKNNINKNKISLKSFFGKSNNPKVVMVPLDNSQQKVKMKNNQFLETEDPIASVCADRSSVTDDIIMLKHVNVGTDSLRLVNQETDMDDSPIEYSKCDNSVQTDRIKEIFDSLEIPNVSLIKEKSELREETVNTRSSSLPNLKLPPVKISPYKEEEISSDDISICESASYVFSRATVTYTTRQKINFQVVGNDEKISSSIPPSPLDYPFSVMSVFQKELENNQENVLSDTTSKKNTESEECINHKNELDTLNGSCFNKLMKPSDIISTIRVNNDLLDNDYICEQFQRELNFIDSFFASLQYLENCSLSDKCISDGKVNCLVKNSVFFDSSFDLKNSEYDNILSKLENGANIEDSETMASKSLCLLNLLIRDEQRRAKNLLFVLKMREDALKDFTKSQILWLEKKKKQDNTDISTLKKKQRGALLKLQHECGEMQRMRKALLTLSEKRKVALMKTKKNIELKLNNNVDVDIILGKKKLKRTSSGDRNTSPLKCFDLSSSGCEDSTTQKSNSDVAVVPTRASSAAAIASAEKCVQTGDDPTRELKEHDSPVAAENFVTVDGGYLNIVFNNLALPQIFSGGKQYEVNEIKLKNIVSSTNDCDNGTEIVEKLMEQIKNRDLETSSPSTARSLVEEFDQYYKVLAENDNFESELREEEQESLVRNEELQEQNYSSVVEINSELLADQLSQNSSSNSKKTIFTNYTDLSPSDSPCICELVNSTSNLCSATEEPVTQPSQITGPLPVPVGAAAASESSAVDASGSHHLKSPTSSVSDFESVSSQPQSANSTSLIALTTPVQYEAEELRRQQLAIEREIKALEQQQCRMLVVREIPDKPPPPYTPPTEAKTKQPRMFTVDNNTATKIQAFLTEALSNSFVKKEINHHTVKATSSPLSKDETFDKFLSDFCQESIERHKQQQSDKPWDACNLLPQKPQRDLPTLIENTTADIKEVVTSVRSAVVSGVSGRRTDHIDDILFNEWRRCEPEWTTLHTDEAIVKNQIFDSIFQKILTETIDEYKKTVKASE